MFSTRTQLEKFLDTHHEKNISDFFLHHPIDLTPLLRACENKDWMKVTYLLDRGYSLLWRDARHKQTTLRLLSGNGDEAAFIGRVSRSAGLPQRTPPQDRTCRFPASGLR
jgi:hypothetical protein